jgi:2-phosphoglycerate kinase
VADAFRQVFTQMNETIILTGPIGVGKSTQAKLLAEELGKSLCVYDEIKDNYRNKIGLSREKALAINAEYGVYAMLEYMNEFKSQILEPIIDDHPAHIIDLGAGTHSFDKPHQIERARRAFDLVNEVIRLLPSNDLATNIKSLPGIKENYEINTYLIMHPTN